MAPRLEDIEPMLLGEVPRPFDTAGWTAELKFDGYRLLAGVEDGHVHLKSRNGANATSWYPELQSLASLPNGTILDGEVCMLDDIGRSDFMRLQARSRRRGRPAGSDPVVFCAFDLLVHRGQDMRAKPLKQRQAKLARALEKPLAHVLLVQDMPDKVPWLYEQALALQLEGIVAKRPGAIPAQRFKR